LEIVRLLDNPKADAPPVPLPWRVDISKVADLPEVDAAPAARPSCLDITMEFD
jgi:hypothetical protein